MKSIILAACVLGLAACGQSRLQTKIQIEPVLVPAELLACTPDPDPPTGTYTQADVAGYIVDLHSAGEDCREKIGRIAALQASTPKGPTP